MSATDQVSGDSLKKDQVMGNEQEEVQTSVEEHQESEVVTSEDGNDFTITLACVTPILKSAVFPSVAMSEVDPTFMPSKALPCNW